MSEQHAIQRACQYFLDDRNSYGCAETTFMVLKEAFGLPDPGDPSPAIALNGGVAYSGGMCGVITGAALAVGMLAEKRISDHRLAKRAARQIVADLMGIFQTLHGAVDCYELTGMDLRDEDQHRRFIWSGLWRTRCLGQIETAVRLLVPLTGEDGWRKILEEIIP